MEMPSEAQGLVQSFVSQILRVIETATEERIQGALAAFLGTPPRRGPGRPPKVPTAPSPAKVSGQKRRVALTPKVVKARRLQGQYLGTIRRLDPAARKRVSALAKEKGVAAALELARSLRK